MHLKSFLFGVARCIGREDAAPGLLASQWIVVLICYLKDLMMSTREESVCADQGVSKRLLATLQDRIGTQKYNAWFKHGTRLAIEDGHVRFTVPNPFVASWIETHYQSEIASAVEKHIGQDGMIHLGMHQRGLQSRFSCFNCSFY